MPSIKLKEKTKNEIDRRITVKLREKIKKASEEEKIQIIRSMISARNNKGGITYDEYINSLLVETQ